MGIQSTGIGSNLDVNSLITKLMQVESQPLTTLAKKEASFQAKLSAYGTLNSALSVFQSNVTGLNNLGSFQALTASSGDTSILSATTTSVSTQGSYNINVTKLAQAQTISSAGQVSTTSSIGSGASTTISFNFGTITGGALANGIYTGSTFTQDATQATGTVTIDGANNSLQGIRDAINAASVGATATIVGDGSATPYHLVITSSKTGATSSLKISASGDATIQNLLNYDPAGTQNLTETTNAQNAALTVNGIAISSASNAVSGAIQGTTVNVAKIGSTNLTLTTNTSGIQSSINGFVKGFNDLQSTLKNLTGYDASSKKGGILIGDATARNIQSQIRSTLTAGVNGLGGNITTLASIGINFQKDGTLAIDSSKLQSALNNNYSEISGLFASVGKATDSLISYSSSTTATQQGAYSVEVSALAAQGGLLGNLNLNTGNTTIAANTKIDVTLDGKTASVALAAGSYSATNLATLIQTSINGTTTFKDNSSTVIASINSSGFLQIQSTLYGSTSNVSLADNTGTSAATLTGTTLSGTAGINVAGKLNGVSATGSGQSLTGATGTAVEGLKILISGGSVGARGTVNFSKGYATQITNLLSTVVGTAGSISSASDGVNRSIKDIGNQRDTLNSRLFDVEARYRAQFTALDSIISNLNNTSSFLTQQLAALTASTK
ncbi:flagellar filament capping protein FliD [Undibacterium sp. RuTC16W]|uniref:flagellar filament capping protein FliD n=1 Tax=Undibacterium sp. RuTC16W TaxID=3413048 RepID=UPI003BF096A2